jgi:hypothetical protein
MDIQIKRQMNMLICVQMDDGQTDGHSNNVQIDRRMNGLIYVHIDIQMNLPIDVLMDRLMNMPMDVQRDR